MIQNILNRYFDGNISIEDALLECEEKRRELEMELTFLKDFKQEKAEEVATIAKEYEDGYKGFRFEVRQGRITYNYRGIEEWDEINKQKQDVEKKYKSMLNAKINGAIHANVSADGEELKLPEISYGKPSVIIKEMQTA